MSRRNLERHLLAAATLEYGPSFRFTRARFARFCFPPDYDYSDDQSDHVSVTYSGDNEEPDLEPETRFAQKQGASTTTVTCTCPCSTTDDQAESQERESHFTAMFEDEHCEPPSVPNSQPCRLHMDNYMKRRPWRGKFGDYSVHSVQFSPDGTKLLAGCENASIRVIDTADGSQNFTPVPSRANLGLPISTIRFMPPKLGWALGCHARGEVFAFKPDQVGFETVIKEQQQTYTFDISPDGNELATGGNDRRIRVYTLRPDAVVGMPSPLLDVYSQDGYESNASRRVIRQVRPHNAPTDFDALVTTQRLHFPGGRPDQIVDTTCRQYQLVRCYGNKLEDYQAPDAPEPAGYVRDYRHEPPLREYVPTAPGVNITNGHSKRIMALRYHPQKSSLLFSAGWDNLVKVWDTRLQAGPVWQLFGPHVASPDALDVDQDYMMTASWRAQRSLEIWDLRMMSSTTGQSDHPCNLSEQGDLSGRDGPAEVIPISGPQWIANASLDGGEYPYGARILPNRSVVVGGSGFYEVRVIGRDTHEAIARIWTDSVVQSLDVILEGRYVAAGCASGTVCIIGLV